MLSRELTERGVRAGCVRGHARARVGELGLACGVDAAEEANRLPPIRARLILETLMLWGGIQLVRMEWSEGDEMARLGDENLLVVLCAFSCLVVL